MWQILSLLDHLKMSNALSIRTERVGTESERIALWIYYISGKSMLLLFGDEHGALSRVSFSLF